MDPLGDRLSERMRLTYTILVHIICRYVNFVIQILTPRMFRGGLAVSQRQEGRRKSIGTGPRETTAAHTCAPATPPKKKPLVLTPGAFVRRDD